MAITWVSAGIVTGVDLSSGTWAVDAGGGLLPLPNQPPTSSVMRAAVWPQAGSEKKAAQIRQRRSFRKTIIPVLKVIHDEKTQARTG
jgi:hypothetical protein